MKKLLKIVLSVFMAMALAIQLPVNLVSVVNAEDNGETTEVATNDETGEENEEDESSIAATNDDTASIELDASSTTIYLPSGFGYFILDVTLDEDYTVEYSLSEDGIIELEEIDDAMYFEAVSEGTVTVQAILTTESGASYESNTIDINVKDYLDVIADNSIEDPDNSNCYFVYNVLSEEDKTVEITDYYFNDEDQSSPYSINIPSTINGYTVVSIGDGAFYGCGDTMKIFIPTSVTNIDTEAFSKYFPIRTFYVYSGSAALQYVIDNGFNYVIIDDTSYGDTSISISYDGETVYDLMYDTVVASSYDWFDFDYGITTVSDSDIAKIKSNLASNQEVLKYFGFELTVEWYGYVDDDYENGTAYLTDLAGEITFTITMDTSKYVDGTLIILLLNADGTVTKITPTVTETGLTFSTSKIGSFALVYTDPTTSSSTVSSVQTGDESQLAAYVLLGGIALVGAYYTRKRKYN
ncbi:MAG: leucine-rich repeat domain-containing protein [Erysipelotrichaceae bacterium]|nr:leucine-rich repeat domain-containing protein [Erysipelotrichaceae bacterium]